MSRRWRCHRTRREIALSAGARIPFTSCIRAAAGQAATGLSAPALPDAISGELYRMQLRLKKLILDNNLCYIPAPMPNASGTAETGPVLSSSAQTETQGDQH